MCAGEWGCGCRWVEHLERKKGRGGWAERCPTVGGTDEVREKWREKKGQEELRKGTLKWVHFLFQTQRRRKEKTLTPGSQENAVHKNRRVKRRGFLAEPKELNLKHGAKKKKHLYTAGCVSHCSGMWTHSRTTMTSPC